MRECYEKVTGRCRGMGVHPPDERLRAFIRRVSLAVFLLCDCAGWHPRKADFHKVGNRVNPVLPSVDRGGGDVQESRHGSLRQSF